MTKTLKERNEKLAEREATLKEELDLNSEEMMDKAKQVGKVALISGGIALLTFWIYKAFFENEDKSAPKKKSKKRKRVMKTTSNKLAEMALPYVGKALNSIFKDDAVRENVEMNYKKED